jgi:hypothetical protein
MPRAALPPRLLFFMCRNTFIQMFVVASMPHLFHRSFLAVDLFFLMSGLVIARSYEARLLKDEMSFFAFVRTRLVLLYPLYIVGTVLGFIYTIAKSSVLMAQPYQISQVTDCRPATPAVRPSLRTVRRGGVGARD